MRPAIALVALAAVSALAWPVTATAAAGARTSRTSMCVRYQHLDVDGRYTVYNDTFGSPAQCLVNRDRWANFQVTVSKASTRGPETQAFPDIYYGCSRGWCSPGSTLPERVSALKSPEASWYNHAQAAGRWNAAFDVWFSRGRQTSGQPNGAELMIWLDAHSYRIPTTDHGRFVRIEGTWWYFDHWHPCRSGACWNYVRFWRSRSTWHVHNLQLAPFIKAAERAGLISRSWWLETISTGYELWRGGQGLATTRFSARG